MGVASLLKAVIMHFQILIITLPKLTVHTCQETFPKGNSSEPTPVFQVRTVRFREGTCSTFQVFPRICSKTHFCMLHRCCHKPSDRKNSTTLRWSLRPCSFSRAAIFLRSTGTLESVEKILHPRDCAYYMKIHLILLVHQAKKEMPPRLLKKRKTQQNDLPWRNPA